MENYPKPVTQESHKKIEQYLDNSIYKIKGSKGEYGKGIFCSMKVHDVIVYMLITDYKTINEDFLKSNENIEILIDKEIITIERDYIYYMNKD